MSANTPSLNRLIEVIQEVCTSQFMVKQFRFGPLWDMDNTWEQIETPYIWVEPMNGRITMGNGSHTTGLYTFTFYCMDRISKSETNYIEILSDTKYILDTIMMEIDQHPLLNQLGITFDKNTDIIFEPVMEATDTYSNGHSAVVTLRYPIRYNPCNNPIGPLSLTYSFNP